MELIYNAMMASVKTSAERANSTDKSGEKDGFQKLMDQKQSGTAASQQETGETTVKTEDAAVSEKVEAEEAPVMEDLKELEKRMSLAAMAAMAQNPIVADIAEETPQVLTDPSWEEGLVPVGYEDNGDLRIVHWMQADAAGQNMQAENAVAGEWVEAQNTAEAEAPVAEVDIAPAEEVEIPAVAVEETMDSMEQEDSGADLPEEAPAETQVFGEVEAAPVKVGEAPAQESASDAENVGDQVGPWMAKLSENMTEGDTRTIVVHLEPESMGKIQLEMTLNKDGSLHVALHAENSHTQSLLSRNSEGLAAILGKYTQNEVQVEVPRQEESQKQDFLNQEQQKNQQQQQEQRKSRQHSGEDFLQQMRLGLVSLEEE